MINITSECLTALQNDAIQKARITVSPLNSEPFIVTEENIIQGGLTIDARCTNDSTIQTGDFTSAYLTMKLNNENRQYDNIFFGGAQLRVEIGITLADSSVEWINSGVYTVDEQPRKSTEIEIEAFDVSVRLDVEFNSNAVVYPTSRRNLVIAGISAAGLFCNDYSMFSDASDVTEIPVENNHIPTWRQIIMNCCEIDGVCGCANEDGDIVFKWYDRTKLLHLNNFTISESDRYQGSSIEEQDTIISGFQFLDNNIKYPATVDETYLLLSNDNNIFKYLTDKEAIADNLNNSIKGFTYRGYSCDTLSYPMLRPLDRIYYKRNGIIYDTIITNYTFNLNGKMSITAKTISQTAKGYASLGAFTSSQKAIVNTIEKTATEASNLSKQTSADLSAQENAILHLNETAANAMGLYTETVVDVTGAKTEYWFDKPTKEESQYICMQNAGGSFSTNTGWNDGHPVWTEGTDKYGNALCSLLDAIGIKAEWISAESITTDKLSIGQSERGTNLIEDSSFESNSIYLDALVDEQGHAVTYVHNDYWNYAQFTIGETYDPEPVSGVEIPIPSAPIDDSGFDGNKAQIDVWIPPHMEGDNKVYGFETLNPIKIAALTHTLSFYYRFKSHNTEEIQTRISNGECLIKIQWLNSNKQPLSSQKIVFTVVSGENDNWQRYHELVTPPNGAEFVKVLTGFKCTDDAIYKTDGGFLNYAFFDIDGFLFEQGAILNSWTCSESEVNNNGVIIDSKGLNIVDGKIYVTDKLGRKVLLTDGYQILQMIGGLTSQKYNPSTGDVSARMRINPIQFDEQGQRDNYLGMSFDTIDKTGKATHIGNIGVELPPVYENYGKDYVTHPEEDKERPISFNSANGFKFNGAHPLINDSQYVPNGTDLNNLTNPGWYHNGANIYTTDILNIPEHLAFSMTVETIGEVIVQTFTLLDRTKTYKRWYQSWDPTGWQDWVKYSADSHFDMAYFSEGLSANFVHAGGDDGAGNGITCIKDITCNGIVHGEIDNWSDRTKKKNIKKCEITNATDIISSLKHYDYDLLTNGRHSYAGLMADEAPKCILGKDGKSINLYSYIDVCAIAISELSAEIKKLKGEKNDGKNK